MKLQTFRQNWNMLLILWRRCSAKARRWWCFVTELTVNFYSAKFISENGCDPYYVYNRGLLFGERQREFRRKSTAFARRKAETGWNRVFYFCSCSALRTFVFFISPKSATEMADPTNELTENGIT